jgi:SAM-dependent methyltransferase
MTQFSSSNIDHNKEIETAISIYDEVQNLPTTLERVLCNDIQRQFFRFAEIATLIGDLHRPNLSICDIGCGNGEFLLYLNQRGFTGKYTGCDIHEGLIKEAKVRFPNENFEVLDIFKNEIQKHDIIVISGVFNLDYTRGEDPKKMLAFIRDFLLRSALFANEKIIFNAISSYVGFQQKEFFYFDPKAAIEIASEISSKFELRHGFLPYNYTFSINIENGKWNSYQIG